MRLTSLSKTIIGAISLSAVMVVFSVYSTADIISPQNLESVRALEGGSVGDQGLVGVLHLVRHVYRVPISYEPHPAYGRLYKLPDRFKIQFRVTRNESLPHCLDRWVAASDGLLEWRWIGKKLWVLPKKSSPDEKLSSLDDKVSLELQNVSAWEAIKAIVRQLNEHRPGEPKIIAYPSLIFSYEFPPADFVNGKSISLNPKAVCARDALTAVLDAYGDNTCLQYFTSEPTDYIVIHFLDDSGKEVEMKPESAKDEELAKWWVSECTESNF